MPKRKYGSIEGFIEYNEAREEWSNNCWRDVLKKDIVLFWINHISFRMKCYQRLGSFEYNSGWGLTYGIAKTPLNQKELSSDEFDEIMKYYQKKGYSTNYIGNVITEDPDNIIIRWKRPNKQTLNDIIYIIKFRIKKAKKIFAFHRWSHNIFISLRNTLIDMIDYERVPSAKKMRKKTLKRFKIRRWIGEKLTQIGSKIKMMKDYR